MTHSLQLLVVGSTKTHLLLLLVPCSRFCGFRKHPPDSRSIWCFCLSLALLLQAPATCTCGLFLLQCDLPRGIPTLLREEHPLQHQAEVMHLHNILSWCTWLHAVASLGIRKVCISVMEGGGVRWEKLLGIALLSPAHSDTHVCCGVADAQDLWFESNVSVWLCAVLSADRLTTLLCVVLLFIRGSHLLLPCPRASLRTAELEHVLLAAQLPGLLSSLCLNVKCCSLRSFPWGYGPAVLTVRMFP